MPLLRREQPLLAFSIRCASRIVWRVPFESGDGKAMMVEASWAIWVFLFKCRITPIDIIPWSELHVGLVMTSGE